jgi:hypothetical protein
MSATFRSDLVSLTLFCGREMRDGNGGVSMPSRRLLNGDVLAFNA